MNIHRLHRRIGRALARVGGIVHRRTPAARADTSPSHWTIPNLTNPGSASDSSADWRQRLLQARGEQIHTASMQRNDRCAIAILDAKGIVICWHDNLPRARPYDPGVLNRYVSQFYLPDDIALHVPARHLSIAAEYGVDTQRGWRRRPAGEIFWGVTIMQSILLGEGEVLGYSHVTRCLRAPAQQLSRSLRATPPRTAGLALMAQYDVRALERTKPDEQPGPVVELSRTGSDEQFICSLRDWNFLRDLGRTFGWHPTGTIYLPQQGERARQNPIKHDYQPGDSQDSKRVEADDAARWVAALDGASRSAFIAGMLQKQTDVRDANSTIAEHSLQTQLQRFIAFARRGAFTIALRRTNTPA